MWGLREELVPLNMLIREQKLVLSKNPPPSTGPRIYGDGSGLCLDRLQFWCPSIDIRVYKKQS